VKSGWNQVDIGAARESSACCGVNLAAVAAGWVGPRSFNSGQVEVLTCGTKRQTYCFLGGKGVVCLLWGEPGCEKQQRGWGCGVSVWDRPGYWRVGTGNQTYCFRCGKGVFCLLWGEPGCGSGSFGGAAEFQSGTGRGTGVWEPGVRPIASGAGKESSACCGVNLALLALGGGFFFAGRIRSWQNSFLSSTHFPVCRRSFFFPARFFTRGEARRTPGGEDLRPGSGWRCFRAGLERGTR
jgi:hypothetical protein